MPCDFNETQLTDGAFRYVCRACQRVVDLPQRHPVHAFCPAADSLSSPPAPPPAGPGSELKRLLARFGIRAAADCPCNGHAAEMDRGGPEWCRANLEHITDWLAEEAARRKLPFVRTAARLLVTRAIRNAEKAAATHHDPQ
jgi:hypothetical protein